MVPWTCSHQNLCQSPYNLLCNSAGLNFLLFHFRESDHQIQVQALEICHLKKMLRKGREVSSLINDTLKDIITQEGSNCHKGHHLHELLAQGNRLTECLACKLSPGNVTRGPDYTELLQGPWIKECSTPEVTF